MNNFAEFIQYCLDFYGWNGLYDQGRTREQIAYATTVYLDMCALNVNHYTWGNGDSLDRERVRDVMNELYDQEQDELKRQEQTRKNWYDSE